MICPSCSTELEFVSNWPSRWTTQGICPKCGSRLLIDFDFTVMGNGDEWDHYTLELLSESIYKNGSTLGLDLEQLKIDE